MFNPCNLFDLLALSHVVVNQTKSAIKGHTNCHFRFGNGIHIGRNDRQAKVNGFAQFGIEFYLSRKNF